MKTSAFLLAALLAIPGAAFAGDQAAKTSLPPKPAVEQKAVLDYKATGSVVRTEQSTATGEAGRQGKKLGIDVSPWIMPTYN
ncbi:DUF680 domain-containing protein [Arvimicrobium flavum]|uniref:DUF680 domain-containing protein n=1 Tax=Arvimicrobium flavum TaxID=3393320 RepID=UPI00237AD604|nr:DUF680 domain-containing protein [Mesorhizobium shangrilense]